MSALEYSPAVVTYQDDAGIWAVVEKGLLPSVPLGQISVTNPRTGEQESIPPVQVEFKPADSVPKSSYGDISTWHNTPYLRFFLLQCEDFDSYKSNMRTRLRQWVEQQPDQHYLILYVPMGNSETHAKAHKKVHDKLRSDFKDKVTKLEVNAGLARAQAGWDDCIGRVRASLAQTFVDRCEQYKESARVLSASRFQPKTWDYWAFFIAQEGLAFVCAQFSLEAEALRIYTDLLSVFEQVYYPESPQPHAPEPLPFGGGDSGDDRGRVLDPSRKSVRATIVNKSVKEFEFREYIFARESQMRLTQVQLAEVAREGVSFVTKMANLINEKAEGTTDLPVYFSHVWAYSALVHIGGECESRRDRLKVDPESDKKLVADLTVSLGIVLGDLYMAARSKFERLGVHLELIAEHRFAYAGSGGVETVEPVPESKMKRDRSSTTHLRVHSDAPQGRAGRASSVGSPNDLKTRPGRASSVGTPPGKGDGTKGSPTGGKSSPLGRERTSSQSEVGSRPRIHSWVDPLNTPTQPADGASSPIDTGNASEGLTISSRTLKKNLRNAISFETHYIDLTNAAARNFHHSFRARNVIRLNGEIAAIHFYRRRFEEAEPLFKSLCTLFQEDGWYELVYAVRMQLAECQRQLEHFSQYVISCLQMLEQSSAVTEQERSFYFRELERVATHHLPHVMRGDLSQLFTLSFEIPHAKTKTTYALGETIRLNCVLTSHVPEEVTLPKLSIRVVGNRHRTGQNKHQIIFSLNDVVLKPGRNELEFAEKAFILGRFHYDKLWAELGQLVLAQDLKGDTLGVRDVRVIVEESVSSLEVTIKQPECLIVGYTQLLKIVLQSHSDNIESGTLEITSSSGLAIEDCPDNMLASYAEEGEAAKRIPFEFKNGKATLTDIKSDSVLEFQILVRAKDGDPEKHNISCHIDYTKNTKEVFVYKNNVEVTFSPPFAIDYVWTHCRAEKFMLQVLLKCMTTVPLVISNYTLDPGQSLTLSKHLNSDAAQIQVLPGRIVSLLYELATSPNITGTVQCTLDTEFKIALGDGTDTQANAAGAGPFMKHSRIPLNLQEHLGMFEISTKVDPVSMEGVFLPMQVTVTRLNKDKPLGDDTEPGDLYIVVDCDRSQWFVGGATKVAIAATQDVHTLEYQLVPVTTGYLKVPAVHVVKHSLAAATVPVLIPTVQLDSGHQVLVQPSGSFSSFAGQIQQSQV